MRRSRRPLFCLLVAVWNCGLISWNASAQHWGIPKYGYDFEDLEPHFPAQSVRQHFKQVFEVATVGLNDVLRRIGHTSVARQLRHGGIEGLLRNIQTVPRAIRSKFRFFAGAYLNHDLYFKNLRPLHNSPTEARGELGVAIEKTWGSFEEFQLELSRTAETMLGPGWVWLVAMPMGNQWMLQIRTTFYNDHIYLWNTPAIPLLVVDMWEHSAGITTTSRQVFLKAWWHLVDWFAVEEAFRALDDLSEEKEVLDVWSEARTFLPEASNFGLYSRPQLDEHNEFPEHLETPQSSTPHSSKPHAAGPSVEQVGGKSKAAAPVPELLKFEFEDSKKEEEGGAALGEKTKEEDWCQNYGGLKTDEGTCVRKSEQGEGDEAKKEETAEQEEGLKGSSRNEKKEERINEATYGSRIPTAPGACDVPLSSPLIGCAEVAFSRPKLYAVESLERGRRITLKRGNWHLFFENFAHTAAKLWGVYRSSLFWPEEFLEELRGTIDSSFDVPWTHLKPAVRLHRELKAKGLHSDEEIHLEVAFYHTFVGKWEYHFFRPAGVNTVNLLWDGDELITLRTIEPGEVLTADVPVTRIGGPSTEWSNYERLSMGWEVIKDNDYGPFLVLADSVSEECGTLLQRMRLRWSNEAGFDPDVIPCLLRVRSYGIQDAYKELHNRCREAWSRSLELMELLESSAGRWHMIRVALKREGELLKRCAAAAQREIAIEEKT